MELEEHDGYWAGARESFTLPEGHVYLNSGTWGLSPQCVIDTAVKYTRILESDPLKNTGICHAETNKAKDKLADFVGADSEDMVFMTNTRMALNGIIRGLQGLEAGREILCTDQEYGAIDNVWRFVAAERNLSIRRIPLPKPPNSGEQILELFREYLSDKTQVMAFCHITSQTGLVMPVKQLCGLAREHGVLSIVDGAHAPGMVPLDLAGLGCDCYAASCHKWLCSAKGAAFAYARKPIQSRLEPFFIEHGWGEDSRFPYGYQGCGTENCSSYISVGTAVDFQHRIGVGNIGSRIRELARYARECLTDIKDAVPLTPASKQLSCAMAAYAFPNADFDALQQTLVEHGIHIPHWRLDEGGSGTTTGSRIRVSTHIYNTRQQIDLLADVIRKAQRN